jgi:hypothetical protein
MNVDANAASEATWEELFEKHYRYASTEVNLSDSKADQYGFANGMRFECRGCERGW